MGNEKQATIQTKLYFKEISSYNEITVETPPGYKFLQIITTDGQYPRTVAVFTIYEPYQEVVEQLKSKYDEDNKKNKKDYDDQLNKKISEMKLVQELSDMIQKFKLGDRAYYYKEHISDNHDAILEKHIDSFTISSIEYLQDRVQVNIENGNEYTQRFYLSGSSYSSERKSVDELYKTKEEALTGLKEFHENRIAEKLEKKKQAEIIAAENQKKAELEILKRAEEIKAKSAETEKGID